MAWVANQCGPRMACHEENLASLQQLLGAPLLGDVPFVPEWHAEGLAGYLDIGELLGR